MATDGSLSSNGRTLCLTSKDVELLETVRSLLGVDSPIVPKTGGWGRTYRLQWSSRAQHVWLRGIGLTPAKSLTIGELDVPDDVFADFLRGCIDGDGSIVTYVDRSNASKNPTYVYARLFVSIVSASPRFLQWIQRTVQRLRGHTGDLTVAHRPNRRDIWRLRYAKRESLELLRWMYHSPTTPALRRKRDRAERALAGLTWYRHSLSELDTRACRCVETGKRSRLKIGCP